MSRYREFGVGMGEHQKVWVSSELEHVIFHKVGVLSELEHLMIEHIRVQASMIEYSREQRASLKIIQKLSNPNFALKTGRMLTRC